MSEAHLYPSLAWMQAYAAAVQAHPSASVLRESLAGRFRFVIEADAVLERTHRYDLVVTAGPVGGIEAVAATQDATMLTIRAAYGRWRRLLEGRADVLLYYLTRRVVIEGDVLDVRTRLRDAGPLLASLRDVPTRFL